MITETFRWYALYVKSRHEFVTSAELRRKGVETFLPSVTKLSRWSDRKKTVEFPLFPGYLFVRVFSRAEFFLDILRTGGAVNLVSLEPGNPTPVAEEEILSLRQMIESGQQLDIHPHLKNGVTVRLRKGPLKGAEGILSGKEGQYVFLVNIEILGRSVGVSIHADDFEVA